MNATTERKPIHWSIADMTLGDLVNTAHNRRMDDLCERLFHTPPATTTDSHVPIVNYRDRRPAA